jgi:malate dehydrogenase (oxaloacetate-decarboxylating)(NADP+)
LHALPVVITIMKIRNEDALEYHSSRPSGKLSITPTKPCRTQLDLSLAYTPGVAVPCLEIEKDPDLAYRYTSKGNLVAVVSNGTAVLGLGDIGAAAGKPVMEGKAVLFKRFADIDVFDIELATHDPKEVIRACQLLEPTFGGINLEDIKAPDCFIIEEELRRTMRIPVFHDDQHGTAIISGAALINALELVGKQIGEARIVFLGAGAGAIACANHAVRLGAKVENILMCDSKGVIYKGRTQGMNPYKERYAAETDRRTLTDALDGADVFFGLSVANSVTPEMLKKMAPKPIVFALANPDPEIPYDVAVAARPDAIVATGRSDYPNQVNNVLGFPFIFRGALDVRATTINDQMMLAATHALAALAREDVPDSVRRVYGVEGLEFGPTYIIPKPFDHRVLIWEASAVARAAMETGVARRPVNIDEYKEELERRLGRAHHLMRIMIHKAQRKLQRIVFPEGDTNRVIRAAQILIEEKIAKPILLGDADVIKHKIGDLHLHVDVVTIIDPSKAPLAKEYAEQLYELRHRKGVTQGEAQQLIQNKFLFGAMMVRMHHADGLVGGFTQAYPETIRPALQVIPIKEGMKKISGVYLLITHSGEIYFLADATVNVEPTTEDLAEIGICAADTARRFDVEPRVAFLSFSNFGSARHPLAEKMATAAALVRQRRPDLMVDGEMQADTAVVPDILERVYPFSTLKGSANVLIFPNLEAGNIAARLLAKIGGAESIGPILMGLSRPVHVVHRDADVNDIVHLAAIASVEAQENHLAANAHELASIRG